MLAIILSIALSVSIVLNVLRIVEISKNKKITAESITPWTGLEEFIPKIKVKYFNPELEELGFIEGQKSNWIDLRSAKHIELKAGEFSLVPLGVAMELPEGYEAHVAPRGSTFKTWGVIQTNSVGIVDHIYKGDNDEWFMPIYATRDTVIKFNDRVCQFRIMPIMGDVIFNKVAKLENHDRGGHGTTGVN